MLGLLLALTGMGLFAVFTACFASWFLEKGEQEERASIATLQKEVRGLRQELRSLHAALQDKSKHQAM